MVFALTIELADAVNIPDSRRADPISRAIICERSLALAVFLGNMASLQSLALNKT